MLAVRLTLLKVTCSATVGELNKMIDKINFTPTRSGIFYIYFYVYYLGGPVERSADPAMQLMSWLLKVSSIGD